MVFNFVFLLNHPSPIQTRAWNTLFPLQLWFMANSMKFDGKFCNTEKEYLPKDTSIITFLWKIVSMWWLLNDVMTAKMPVKQNLFGVNFSNVLIWRNTFSISYFWELVTERQPLKRVGDKVYCYHYVLFNIIWLCLNWFSCSNSYFNIYLILSMVEKWPTIL